MAASDPQPPRLSSDDVRRIVVLFRMALSDEEVERMREQLSNILEQFQVLQTIETTGIEPTGHAVEVETVMREDTPGPALPVEEVLANAPRREGDYFRVRLVLE